MNAMKEFPTTSAVLNSYEQKLIAAKKELLAAVAKNETKLEAIKEIKNDFLTDRASSVIASSYESTYLKPLTEKEINSLNTLFQDLSSNDGLKELLKIRNPWEMWPQDLGDPS